LFSTKRSAVLLGLLLLSGAAGCSRVARVSGRVVEDGQPYAATDEMVALVFTRVDSSMKLSVSVQKDGSFVVYGPNNEGLAPGKYKVGYYSEIDGDKSRKRIKDLPADKSTLELDLAAGDSVYLTIDLVKGTMTKK
jgi:hypothetical protein